MLDALLKFDVATIRKLRSPLSPPYLPYYPCLPTILPIPSFLATPPCLPTVLLLPTYLSAKCGTEVGSRGGSFAQLLVSGAQVCDGPQTVIISERNRVALQELQRAKVSVCLCVCLRVWRCKKEELT
eukprot:3747595-Rhodomonas_salina.1